MPHSTGGEVCESCGRGRLVKRLQPISFMQWTDKGYLSCHAVVPMTACDSCDAKFWDEAAEQMIEEAVRKEYDKLP